MAKFTPTIEQVSADGRGEIFIVNLPDNVEMVLLHSVAGSLRGGHSHDVDEIVVMLTGKMRYHKLIEGSKQEIDLEEGQSSYNCAGDIHMGEFLEDSWLIEQKLAKKGEWVNRDYNPWREKVKSAANTAGR